MFDIGDTIGDYRIVSRLSEGGMATLYLGRRADAPEGDPPVAIKVIHEHLSEDWQFVRMFVDEALISVRIRHRNVVRVDELNEQDNVYYLVMEYVHGCSVAELLRAMGRRGRRMRPEIAVWIATQVAAGLHAAHEMTGHDGQLLGVVHRDVSPQNVLLSIDGGVKLLDFGIAKAKGRAERTEAGVIKGKVRYMSPEQAAGTDIDRRVDVYALGVVLWEMLTMRRYIEGATDLELIRKVQNPDVVPPSFRAEGVDPRIDDAVMAALAPEVARRPPTAAAFQELLESAVSPGTVGPSHVAELLRVFVRTELEEAAQRLPNEVGAPLAMQARAPTPLPGEDESTTARMGDVERTRTLTMNAPVVELSEDDEAEATRSARPATREPETEDVDLGEIDVDPFEAPTDENPPMPELAPFGADDDERTVEASGHEVAAFLAKIQADSPGRPQPGGRAAPPPPRRPPPPPRPGPPPPRQAPAPPSPGVAGPAAQPFAAQAASPAAATGGTPSGPQRQPAPQTAHTPAFQTPGAQSPAAQIPAPSRNLPTREMPGEQAPPPPAEGPGLGTWVLRVIVITLVAFAVGAGAAVAWVQLLR